MNASPKTIQIFLPDGDPRGVRVAEITTRIVQVIEIPRPMLDSFFTMPESNQVGVYFLVGESESETGEAVYVGQTGDLRTRLNDHNKKKDFWERALVLISRTNSLTQTHAGFLEWYFIQEIRKAGRYQDENQNSGSRPHTPPPLEAECLEIFDTGQTLLSTLGHPLSSPVTGASDAAHTREIFHCTGPGADARGEYTNEGFVVLKDSKARLEEVPSIGESMARARKRLIDSRVLTQAGEHLVFQKDHLFGSPSTPAAVILGRRANGWKEWKDSNGRTLDELKRQQP